LNFFSSYLSSLSSLSPLEQYVFKAQFNKLIINFTKKQLKVQFKRQNREGRIKNIKKIIIATGILSEHICFDANNEMPISPEDTWDSL
jgi:hypothetical protein